MNTFILILTLTANAGAVAIEHIPDLSYQQCHSIGQKYMTDVKAKSRLNLRSNEVFYVCVEKISDSF